MAVSESERRRIDARIQRLAVQSDDYKKSFSRYLIIGNGAGITLIISFYKELVNSNSESQTLSFDVPLWIFTTSLLLAGLNFFLQSKYFDHLISGNIYRSYLLDLSSEEAKLNYGVDFGMKRPDKMKALKLDRAREESTKKASKLRKVLTPLLAISSSLFVLGIVSSIFLVTAYS